MIMIRYHSSKADGVDDVNGHECCPSFHGLWMMMVDGWVGGWVGGHGLLYHFALEACMDHGSTSSLHNLGKVDVSKSNIAIILTPIFEWSVYRCIYENGHWKYMCLKRLDYVQNLC